MAKVKPKTYRVLLVEDNAAIENVVSEIIRSHNMEIVSVSNGLLAIQVLEADWEIDVILLDVLMPGMNGSEFLEWFATSKYKDIPVIVMTANARFKTDTYNLNISLLAKPFDLELLLQTIAGAVLKLN